MALQESADNGRQKRRNSFHILSTVSSIFGTREFKYPDVNGRFIWFQAIVNGFWMQCKVQHINGPLLALPRRATGYYLGLATAYDGG